MYSCIGLVIGKWCHSQVTLIMLIQVSSQQTCDCGADWVAWPRQHWLYVFIQCVSGGPHGDQVQVFPKPFPSQDFHRRDTPHVSVPSSVSRIWWCFFSVSFRRVYTGQDTVGLLRTKTTNHTQGISQPPFFRALCLAGAPLHFPAGGLQWQLMFFFVFLLGFFCVFFFWRESSLPHRLKCSLCTVRCVGVMDAVKSCHKCLPHKCWRRHFELQGNYLGLESLWDPEGEETAVPLWSCTLQTFLPTSPCYA